MHGAQAVGEPRRADLGKDQLCHAGLRDPAQPLRHRLVQQLSLNRRHPDIAVDRIADAQDLGHRIRCIDPSGRPGGARPSAIPGGEPVGVDSEPSTAQDVRTATDSRAAASC